MAKATNVQQLAFLIIAYFRWIVYRVPLNILRVRSDEKIFRQMQQNSARIVYPTRRDFVKYHGKDSVDSLREEFLEVPYIFSEF